MQCDLGSLTTAEERTTRAGKRTKEPKMRREKKRE